MTTHTIRAVMTDARAARAAIEQLSRHGIDGDDLHLGDPGEVEAGPSRATDRATDAGVVRRLGSRMALGALIGGIVGLGVGALVFVLAGGQAVLQGALGGAGGGIALGIILGLMATPVMAPAWEAAHAPGPGVRHLVVTNVQDRDLAAVRRIVERHARSLEVIPQHGD